MKLVKPAQPVTGGDGTMPAEVCGINDSDEEERFLRITSINLTPEQRSRIERPAAVLPHQRFVLAVHWHPEHIPLELIDTRIRRAFPNVAEELIIPTQHNEIMSYQGFSGVEIDCYCRGFRRKVQLLLHFREEKLAQASALQSAISHTFKYRSSQLFEFIHALTRPNETYLNEAAKETGADARLVALVREQAGRIEQLLARHIDSLPPAVIKNNLVRNYFDTLRPLYGDARINRAQTFLKVVKKRVKANFSLTYFFRTSEIIEEARALGAGVVIPHPEQFWPILLADYDVDGFEVWNPQSYEYTEFLISVVINKNRQAGLSKRKLLIFMGDDTHMGEKARAPEELDAEKAAREIGVQPAWDDLHIRKKLIMAEMDRHKVIAEYRRRLLEQD